MTNFLLIYHFHSCVYWYCFQFVLFQLQSLANAALAECLKGSDVVYLITNGYILHVHLYETSFWPLNFSDDRPSGLMGTAINKCLAVYGYFIKIRRFRVRMRLCGKVTNRQCELSHILFVQRIILCVKKYFVYTDRSMTPAYQSPNASFPFTIRFSYCMEIFVVRNLYRFGHYMYLNDPC